MFSFHMSVFLFREKYRKFNNCYAKFLMWDNSIVNKLITENLLKFLSDCIIVREMNHFDRSQFSITK